MSTNTNQPQADIQATLKEAAAYVDIVGPRLEKLASVDSALKTASEQLPGKLLAHGLISRLDAEKLARDISGASGVSKLAELVDFALTHAVSARRELGTVASKQAALGGAASKPRTSADVWADGFSPRNRR